jgi:extracellular factor (EF) 3-hydroxypalmitic acid methyl ester biosynthesis protein
MTRVKRLRSSRYRPGDLAIGVLYANFEHGGERLHGCAVLDVSGQGAAISIAEEDAPFLCGDSLSQLRIYRHHEVFFDGEAVVRNVRHTDGVTVVGLAFRGAFLDMPRLHETELRAALQERLDHLFGGVAEVAGLEPAFKATVADLAHLLDALRGALEAEEERLRYLDEPTRTTVEREAVALVVPRLASQLDDGFARLEELTAGLDDGDRGRHLGFAQSRLRRRFTTESPLFHRAFHKPLGYAGDYEVMNMMYGDREEGGSLYARALTGYGRQTPAARAVVNRIGYLADAVRCSLQGLPEARVASIACGPAREIESLLDDPARLPATRFTLIDVEPRAIRYCERVLLERARARDLEDKVEFCFIRETVRTLIRRERIAEVLEPQDAIVSVGLFDYFSDLLFQRLLARLYALLRPGGQLWIGNFSPSNASRFFMEQMLDWYLFHRDAPTLERLSSSLPPEAMVSIESEPLGVNLFLHVTKPDA